MSEKPPTEQLREQRADCVALRKTLKSAMAQGEVTARQGRCELEELDHHLSSLDTEFRRRWDAAHPRQAG